MKKWRSPKRRKSSSPQPTIPGLLAPSPPPNRPSLLRKAATPTEIALDRAKLRLTPVVVVFSLAFLLIGTRVADLTVFQEQEETTPTRSSALETPITNRADIVDRNGTVLATSLPTVTLLADTKKLLDIDEAVTDITSILTDLNPDKLKRDLSQSRRYVTIRRHLTPRQYYAINKMGLAGIEFTPDEGRIYPAGSLTSHLLGYTDIDNNGIAGLEKSQNAYLKESSKPLATTIDLRLQTILHRELSQAVNEFKAIGAAGLVMDATNGDILALVSLPDYDPQNAGKADENAKFNRATLGVYEMGSTFKTFNTAAAFEAGITKPSERFDTTQPIHIGTQRIRDFHPSSHWLNVAEIFMESSNIGSARMAERLGSARQRTFLKSLGLLDKSPIELPEVGTPIVPSTATWGDTTTMTVSFGHGVAVNAVQVASAAATLVNDGRLIRPTLLKMVDEDRASEEKNRPRIVSPKTVALMRAFLRFVVKYGTAQKAEVNGYIVGGKTGTADKLTGKRYSENARLSSFIGVFPVNAPRYVVLTLLDDPKGTTKTYGFATGGWTAAPVVGRVIAQIGPLLNIPPADVDVLAQTEQHLMKPLGSEILQSLHQKADEDYASVESNNAQ